MTKRWWKSIIFALSLLGIMLSVSACGANEVERPQTEYFTVCFAATEGGIVHNAAVQTVEKGKGTTYVYAEANDDYTFVGWSDGYVESERRFESVISDITVTAIFKPFNVFYTATVGGSIGDSYGDGRQYVENGEDAYTVRANPNEGYRFVGWSDGITTEERTDRNITGTLRAEARFERITFAVEYNAEVGGSIVGEQEQTVYWKEDANEVTAIENEGYTFVGWSDGVETATRTDEKILSDKTVTARFERIYFHAEYSAGSGGSIEGKTKQTIGYGDDIEAVTAVPDDGYVFIGWSDGVTTAERTDSAVKSNKQATARFELVYRRFMYNHNKETNPYSWEYQHSNDDTDVKLYVGQVQNTRLFVPEKEHCTFEGWYLDEDFTVPVADSTGTMLMSEDILDSETTDLYAKWTYEQVFTYKILLVFVTEIHATLKATDGTPVAINFVMTDSMRKECEKLPALIEARFEDLLDGMVDFEVDTYFTTQSIDESNIWCYHGWIDVTDTIEREYSVWAEDIPEVEHLEDKYHSVFAFFNFGESTGNLFLYPGDSAHEKYASMRMPDYFLDGNLNLDSYMDGCVHEFIHTLEMWYWNVLFTDFYDYHRYGVENNTILGVNVIPLREEDGLFLRNQGVSIVTGERVGIPYEFWTDILPQMLLYVDHRTVQSIKQ